MFSESAEFYDAIYSVFKDYAEEATAIADLLRGRSPGVRTLLDVGCGTGEHARQLRTAHGFAVDGIDLDERMVRLATEKNPDGRFVTADMVDFELGRTYDAVICLFSSIGYVRTLENLGRAIRSMARHLAPGGVLVVEPWFGPDRLETGRVYTRAAEAAEMKVCRMSHTTVDGRLSRIVFEYLIGTTTGIHRATEIHELGLFTVDETLAAFRSAGLGVDHDEAGLTGRGLFIGRIAS